MSEPPPPIDDEEKTSTSNIDQIDLITSNSDNLGGEDKKNLSDDLFFSTISDPPQKEAESKKVNEDMDEVFRINSNSVNKEIKLTDDEEDNDPFSVESAKAVEKSADIKIQPVISPSSNNEPEKNLSSRETPTILKTQSSSISNSYQNAEDTDDEERDKFLDISISSPTKVGDGMGSYMVYKITTKTNLPAFKSQEFSANRRFSDFLSLYEKLKEKHLQAGRVLPPAPEKDMIIMAKVKMSNKEENSPIDSIEKRRAALQRFLTRLGKHKTFRYDPDFRDFLEIAEDLPKATNTSTLSGAGMLKMFKNVTDSVSKIAIKMEETDQWFEEKTHQIENLYVQYKKMHSIAELLYGWRKDLATSSKEFSKSTSILANSEEQLSLSRSLSQLGEIYEKIDQIYLNQSNADYFIFAELVKDYVCLFDNIKEVLHQRVKTYSNWQKVEEALRAKREAKAKLEAANKQDKIPAVAAEINDLETKVEKAKSDFEQISKLIKEEMKRFDINRAKEFKVELTKYLQTLLSNQEEIVKIWEQYLPQVKAI